MKFFNIALLLFAGAQAVKLGAFDAATTGTATDATTGGTATDATTGGTAADATTDDTAADDSDYDGAYDFKQCVDPELGRYLKKIEVYENGRFTTFADGAIIHDVKGEITKWDKEGNLVEDASATKGDKATGGKAKKTA